MKYGTYDTPDWMLQIVGIVFVLAILKHAITWIWSVISLRLPGLF